MSMTILFMGSGNVFKNRVAALAITLLLFAPVSSFCQDQDDESIDEPATSSSSVWQGTGSNSNGIGSASAERPATPGQPATPAIGARGPQITSDDPGGNPDVPFDANMNILFLLSGIAFSLVVIKKQFKIKLAAAK